MTQLPLACPISLAPLYEDHIFAAEGVISKPDLNLGGGNDLAPRALRRLNTGIAFDEIISLPGLRQHHLF
jgi:hypothetical protein